MEARKLRTGRWIVGGVVFLIAATILFEDAGQSSPRPRSVRGDVYRELLPDDAGVTTALAFALSDQQKKNRSDGALRLRRVISAEHRASNGDMYRLCISLERHGRTDTARAVVHRSARQQWSVALWAWGACGK